MGDKDIISKDIFKRLALDIAISGSTRRA